MRGALRASNWPLLALATLCLGLLFMIGSELMPRRTDVTRAAPVAAAARIDPNVQAGFAMSPLGAYAAVLERPLFSRTRRPAAQAGLLPASSSFTLVAIVISGDDRHALLASGQPAKTVRVTAGEDVGGWTVESILADRVIVRHGDQREEVKAREPKKTVAGAAVPSPSIVVSNGQPVAQRHKAHDE